jgi:hypothetical protein
MYHNETEAKAPEQIAQVVQVVQVAPLPTTAQVELFDPPLCCPTGLCGPTLDQTLLDVSETVLALKERGVGVERYQMASHPHVFLKHPEVMRLVRERGMEAFPITVVAGQIVKVGAYLTRHEIEQALLDAEGAKGVSR